MKKYVANRLSGGNRLFPAEITVDNFGVTVKVPGLFGGKEKTLGFDKISSVSIDSPLVGFSKITFDTLGLDQIVTEGFSKSDAEEIKQSVQSGIHTVRHNGNSSYPGLNQSHVELEKKKYEDEERRKRNEESRERSKEDAQKTMTLVKKYVIPYWKVIVPVYLILYGVTCYTMDEMFIPTFLFSIPLAIIGFAKWNSTNTD